MKIVNNNINLKKTNLLNINTKNLFKSFSIHNFLFFLLPLISLKFPQRIYKYIPYAYHIVPLGIVLVLLTIYLYKREQVKHLLGSGFYHILIFFILVIAPYYIHISNQVLPNPTVYIIFAILFLSSLSESNYKLNLNYFIIGSSFLLTVFIIEYLYIFSFPLAFDQIWQNKLNLGYDLIYQSKIYGNIHNVTPFIMGVFILSLFSYTKGENRLSSALFCTLSLFYFILYLSRFCILYCILYMTAVLLIYLFRNDLMRFLIWVLKILRIKKIKYSPSKKNDGINFFVLFLLMINSFIIYTYFSYFLTPVLDLLERIFSIEFFEFFNIKPVRDVSVEDRLHAFRNGLDLIKDNILWGIGPETYRLWDPKYTSPHNFMLKTILENGIFGVILITQLCITALKNFKNYLSLSILSFIIYSTAVGACLIDGANMLNYTLIALLLHSITSKDTDKKHETSPAKS